MAKMLCWTVPLAFAFAALAYSVSLSNIEESKQNAFMMKACVDAGGEWLLGWSGRPYCRRVRP